MIHGKNRIGKDLASANGSSFRAVSPVTGEFLEGDFYNASREDVDNSLLLAHEAFAAFKLVSGKRKADFLEAIAEEIMAAGDELVKRAMDETALPEGRIVSERGRTTGQLKMFADLVREGSWVEASIDRADSHRTPQPKPDLRRMLQAVGPVVVFTASNFPLAFSTAGGDTASALAGGNPVIVKAHPSHPGTNQLVGDAIARAAEKTGMPNGVFSSLNASSYETGIRLVKHPLTRSVAFTGSFSGGMALWKAANEREVPIPVFSEMGSTNPVIILEEAFQKNAESVAKQLAGSITLGAGQFCTNPGIIAGVKSENMDLFLQTLNSAITEVRPQVMLNKSIADNFSKRSAKAIEQKGVKLLSEKNTGDKSGNLGMPSVATVGFEHFKENPELHEEVFGPFSLVVLCKNEKELEEFVEIQKGHLTISFFGTEFKSAGKLIEIASRKAGRVIFNGVPTGVEVNASMQHGGPFPATTDSRFTSVGSAAIKRFVRPVAYQDAPDALLPDELKEGNPLGIWRKEDKK